MRTQTIIQTRDLKKTYVMGETEVHALQGVSFRVNQGEMVAITGPSGSGKSTLMAILGALDVPTAGSYQLDGFEISEMHDDDLSAIRNWRIGFIFQQFNLLPRSTALENVGLPLVYAGISGRERHERAAQALELVGLGDRMDHKPTELSGGQQQRVAVARALVNEPALVLADEPTGNLDSKTGEEIMALFHQLHQEQGITLVIVTHDTGLAEQAERTVVLMDGLIVSDANGNRTGHSQPAQTQTQPPVTVNTPMTPADNTTAADEPASSRDNWVMQLARTSASEVARQLRADRSEATAPEVDDDPTTH